MRLVFRNAIGCLCLVLAVANPAAADDDGSDDFGEDLQERIARVNEGKLEFLPARPQQAVHWHADRLTIDQAALASGWARLEQCHYDMDEISSAEVVFRGSSARNIEIVSSHGIGRAWVDGNSLQLADVARGASLCLRLELQAVHRLEGDRVRVRLGPFMRKFLDGYYPMGIKLEVAYPCDRLRLVDMFPPERPEVTLRREACGLTLETWFEGRLMVTLDFADTAGAGG